MLIRKFIHEKQELKTEPATISTLPTPLLENDNKTKLCHASKHRNKGIHWKLHSKEIIHRVL